MSEHGYITKKQFKELEDKDKWNYVQSLLKQMEVLQIQADKNCLECEKRLITPGDLNIDYLFEDWRACSDHCDKCTKQDQVQMCHLEYEIMNLLAEQVQVVRNEVNALMKVILEREEPGKKIRETLEKSIKKKNISRDSMIT